MKRTNLVPYILLAIVVVMLSSCASSQKSYRGDIGGTPGLRVSPMDWGITQQQLATMSPQQYEELMSRIERYNNAMRDASYAEAYDAYAKKQWVNNPEGGPPIPADVLGSGKAPKVPKQKPSALEQERQKFLKKTGSTTTNELNKAYKNLLKGIFQ